MVGGGPFNLRPGQWTDDTSMALCVAASLVETGRFDPADQMMRYCRWVDEGYMSSNGECFDVGLTTRAALERFRLTKNPFCGPTDPRSAGNGCIMRLAPLPMFCFPNLESAVAMSAESARTTHGAAECLDCCRLLAAILHAALRGATKSALLLDHGLAPVDSSRVAALATGSYINKPRSEIRGSGYVVECLEAALWCFQQTACFEEAILAAANLGDDADTTAAVCGQIAGAHYGEEGIPGRWLDRLALRAEISQLARGLHAFSAG
jgi:ADP-ribosyl-[dinitrogen reductase] hydrolase